jgi:hypothetical protein
MEAAEYIDCIIIVQINTPKYLIPRFLPYVHFWIRVNIKIVGESLNKLHWNPKIYV